MHAHHLMLNTIPLGHPGERRESSEPRDVAATFRRAASEAELVRTSLVRFNSKCGEADCLAQRA